MDPTHHGADRGLHDVGDLLIGEPLDVGEVHRDPEVLGDGLQRVLDVAVREVVDGFRLGAPGRPALGDRLGRAELPVLEVVDGVLIGLPLVLPVAVDERVGEDAVQPRLEVGPLLE